MPLTDASFGRGSGPVHMTLVSCKGNEEIISDCAHYNGIGAINCHHARDAGVVCTSKNFILIIYFSFIYLIYTNVCSNTGGTPEHYSIHASTSPSEGPFAIGSVIGLHCHVSPDSPTGSTYEWKTSVSGVSIIHHHSTDSNASITIPVGHTKYGYYYCQLQKNGSTLATGFTVIEVKCEQTHNSD